MTGRFTQEDPIGLAGGVSSYSYAAGDPANQNDPSGTKCEKVSGDHLKCNDLGPGDAETIRDFLGGSAGADAYQMLRGNPDLRSENCSGGFDPGQCLKVANAASRLVNHGIALCSELGTLFVRTWQDGRVSYKEGRRRYGGAGFLFGPLGRIWLPEGTVQGTEIGLQNIMAHEAAHLKWPLTQLLHLTPRVRDDKVYRTARTCQQ